MKIRWYNTKLKSDFETFYQLIINRPYSGIGRGFEIIDFTTSRILAKYIEKQVTRASVLDPYGDETTYDIVNFVVFNVEFNFSKRNPLLIKMIDPPRSTSGFFDVLNEMILEPLGIDPIKINLEDFYQYISHLERIADIRVTSLHVSKIPFNKNTFAKMELNSSTNAFLEFKEKYKSSSYQISKMSLKFRHAKEDVFWEGTSSGLMSCSPILSSIIERYISKSVLN